jgi:hypothetical protein
MSYRPPSFFYILALVFLVPGCLFYDEEPGEDTLENGPYELRLSGEFNDHITPSNFDLSVEWRTVNSGNSVKAIFFASDNDTVNNRAIQKYFQLSIQRYREWPRGGNFGVTQNPDLSADENGRLHVELYAEYREDNLDPEDENSFLYIDYNFTVSGGNFYITTSNEEVLRGDFELAFQLDRKHTQDPFDEGTIGPIENALMLQGAFDIKLQETRVSSFSSR